jgi:hypothetical protein
MVLNTTGKIAVKCSKCGTFSIVDIDLFKLKSSESFHCKCGNRTLKANVAKGELILNIDCIACEKQHIYRFKLKRVIDQPINIISCPTIGMEIAFLGKDYHVNDFVRKYMDDMFELLKSLGVIREKNTMLVKLK